MSNTVQLSFRPIVCFWEASWVEIEVRKLFSSIFHRAAPSDFNPLYSLKLIISRRFIMISKPPIEALMPPVEAPMRYIRHSRAFYA